MDGKLCLNWDIDVNKNTKSVNETRHTADGTQHMYRNGKRFYFYHVPAKHLNNIESKGEYQRNYRSQSFK